MGQPVVRNAQKILAEEVKDLICERNDVEGDSQNREEVKEEQYEDHQWETDSSGTISVGGADMKIYKCTTDSCPCHDYR